MSLQAFQGTSISFITTNNCTASCPHCVMGCVPGGKLTLSFEQMKSVIDQMMALQEMKLVVFTGGEPTLLKDDLLKAIRYCHDRGVITRIVTNAWWASTPDNARRVLSALRQAGLDEINFSLDDYHAPYVSVENVKTAWHASKGMGFLSVVIANSHGEDSTIVPAWIEDLLEEKVQIRDPDHRYGYTDRRETRAEDGTLYIIAEARLQKTGRASSDVQEGSYRELDDQIALNVGCHLICDQPAVAYDNHLWTCCGVNCEKNEVLSLGDLSEESYSEIMKRASNSVIINAIRYLGPYFLTKYVSEKDPELVFSDNFHSVCEVCEAVTTNHRAVEIMRANPGELTAMIMKQESRINRVTMLGDVSNTRTKLKKLVQTLKNAGYADLFTQLHPIRDDKTHWLAIREKALPELQPYIDLLLLGRVVELTRLSGEFVDAVREIDPLGLFTVYDDAVVANDLVLHPVFGIWMFYENPHPGMKAYFGQDSLALLARQLPAIGQKCLDLCSGPGIQALYAAKQGENVVSVEYNYDTAVLARINSLMNGIDKRLDIRVGNLYNIVQAEEQFDRVLANPPLVPFPEEMPYAFVGHGGDDGLKVTWRILEGVGTHLKENGTVQIIGNGLGDGEKPLFVPKLEELARRTGLDITVSIVNHIPMKRGDPSFARLAQTSQAYCGKPQEEIEEAMERCFTRQGAVEFLAFELFARKGEGRVRVQDLTPDQRNNALWFV